MSMSTTDCDHKIRDVYAKLDSMVVSDERNDGGEVIVDVMAMYKIDTCCGHAQQDNTKMMFTIRTRGGFSEVILSLNDIVWLSENVNLLTDVPIEIPANRHTCQNVVQVRRSGTNFKIYSRILTQTREGDRVPLVHRLILHEEQLKRVLHYCLINSVIKRECIE